jgi:hypothetical protein
MPKNGWTIDTEAGSGNGRFHWFLGTAMLSSLAFGLFLSTCMVVPGILPGQRRWMFGIDALLLACPLTIGLWRFTTTDAPISRQPAGPVLGVIITLELLFCIATFIGA